MTTLETPRLLLRIPREEDLDAWAAFVADPESMRFLGGPQIRTHAWRGMASVVGAWQLRGFAFLSVIERSTGRWVGRVGPWQPEGWPGTEVGWGIAREATGRGYATEAATACIDWAFDHLGWTDVIHLIDPANTASIRVAERLGSARTGHLDDVAGLGLPADVYGQSREAWRARRR